MLVVSAYANLLIGGIGVLLLLLVPILCGCKTCNFQDLEGSKLAESISSVDVRISGVALFVSACPMALDLLLGMWFHFRSKSEKSKLCCHGRMIITIVTLLVGIQIALGKDYFHLPVSYVVSFLFGFSCLRIVTITSLMFCLCSVNGAIFTTTQTSIMSIMAVAYNCLRFYGATSSLPVIVSILNVSSYVWSAYVLIIIFIWVHQLFRLRHNLIIDDYASIYILILFIVTMLSTFSNLVYFWVTGSTYTHVVDVQDVNVWMPIYLQTACCVIMSTVPAHFARVEGSVSKDHVIEAKQAYVSYISHELRTPLNTVFMGLKLSMGQICVNTMDLLELERLSTLTEIFYACEVALDILNDLLLHDKIQMGLVSLTKESLHVTDFMMKCISMFTVQLKSKKLCLRLQNLNPDSAISVDDVADADKSKLGQVIRNLISNAIKFTPDGGDIDVSIGFKPLSSSDEYIPPSRKLNVKDFIAHNLSFERLDGIRHLRVPDEGIHESDKTVTTSSISMSSTLKKFPLTSPRIFPFSNPKVHAVSSYSNRDDSPRLNRIDEVAPDLEVRNLNNCNSRRNTECEVDKLAVHSGKLVIEVKDSGAGISLEDQERLFKEVIQFRPEVLQGGGGSGLGLLISKGIVDLHGGQISVHSEGEGKGTTFRVEIPMTRKACVSTMATKRDSLLVGTSKLKSISGLSRINDSLFGDIEKSSIHKSWDFRDQILDSGDVMKAVIPTPLIDYPNGQNANPVNANEDSKMNETHQLVLNRSNNTSLNTSGDDSIVTLQVNTQLPCERNVAVNANRMESPKPVGNFLNSSRHTSPKLKLLIVDDSKLNRKMLRRLLEAQGHDCEEAEDGKLALDIMRNQMQTDSNSCNEMQQQITNSYDAILMDFVMPVMDGPTATTKIRKLGYKGPIMGVTGNALEKDKEIFMTAGASHVFIKPLDISLVLAALELSS